MPPDAIILDIMKPGSIDGIEGCRRIKKTMQKRTKSKLSYCVKGQKK
ncbi:chemotaxis protein CheY [Methylophaga thiooxydans]|uniref:Chemotaxis protein CheY n=1 Tax=Methylophaga thiooxydans TaxID=392484 RepID=A0A0A0BEW1_9GAMM|nr:chemotaxis protein CheY [Methylophaga thiooxydans]